MHWFYEEMQLIIILSRNRSNWVTGALKYFFNKADTLNFFSQILNCSGKFVLFSPGSWVFLVSGHPQVWICNLLLQKVFFGIKLSLSHHFLYYETYKRIKLEMNWILFVAGYSQVTLKPIEYL